MSWSPEQIAVVESARFASVAAGGYHADDVERLRVRALTAMRKASPLPDLDDHVAAYTAKVIRQAIAAADAGRFGVYLENGEAPDWA